MKSLSGAASGILQSPTARRWLQWVSVGLVLLFFGLAVYSQLPLILSYHWNFDPTYLAIAFVLLVARGPVVVYSWWSVLRTLGYKLPFLTSIRIAYHSALARYLPGQMWYAVSRAYLSEKLGVPRLTTLVSIGIETAFVVASAGLVALLGLVVWRDASLWLAVPAVVTLLVFIVKPDLIFVMLNWGLALMRRQPIETRLSRPTMLRLMLPFVLNWLVYGVMSFALTASLYPQLSLALLPPTIGLFTAAWLVGFLTIIVPQGLAVREGLIFYFLTTLLGIPAPVATATAVLSRAWTILGEAIWASVSTRF